MVKLNKLTLINMKPILKRLLYAITVVPLFIICGILQIISVFMVLICVYPFYWIITGRTFEPDYLFEPLFYAMKDFHYNCK